MMSDEIPQCPSCRQPMQLRTVVPSMVGHSELRTFRCAVCGIVKTQHVERKKPE
jgi:uncharacterized Zn finger protein